MATTQPNATNSPHTISSSVLAYTDANGVAQQVTLKRLPAAGSTFGTDANGNPNNGARVNSDGSVTIFKDGTVVDGYILSHGVVVEANNATISRCDISNSRYGVTIIGNYKGALIEDSSIHDCVNGIYAHDFTVQRSNIYQMGEDGVVASGNNGIVLSSYIHNLGTATGAHADGVAIQGGSNWVIRGNNFDLPEHAGNLSNSCVYLEPYWGPVSNVVIDGNWLNGGNFVVYSVTDRSGTPTGVQVTNNFFGHDYNYGLLDANGTVLWQNNYWMDTNLLVSSGGSTLSSGDTTAPTISNVVASPSMATLTTGNTVTLRVNFNETVTVSSGGQPTLTLNNGGTANYVSGSGSTALTFSYVVAAGQNTADLEVTGLNLNGATIRDAAGNIAVLSDEVINPAGTLAIDTTPPPPVDTTAPLLTSVSPTDNSTNVARDSNLVLTFSEPVVRGSRNIVIHNSSDGTTTNIPVTDSQVTFSGNKVTIDPSNDLAAESNYYVTVEPGAIRDVAGNDYAGISNRWSFNFTTDAPVDPPPPVDTTAPLLTSVLPTDNSTNVARDSNLVLTFSEPVVPGSGNIVIRNSNGTIAQSIPVSQVSFSGNQVTINPSTDLAAGSGYYVNIASGVIHDVAGNNYAGISNSTSFNFTTDAPVSGGGGATPTTSLFSASNTPTRTYNDGQQLEVGVQFQSSVAGQITGLKFYRSASDTGPDVLTLWTATGTKLASVTYTNTAASGWQTAALSTPVAISANTSYVASYNTTGYYVATNYFFNGNAVTSGVLTAPEGVYAYGSIFPTNTYRATNYWADVVFEASAAPAGVAGEVINLGLTNPSGHLGSVAVNISAVPSGWIMSEGTDNGDGTWTVETNDLAALSVTSPKSYTGALVLNVAESWVNADGSSGNVVVTDNVEVYAEGAPIFAIAGDDNLSGSSSDDLFVLAQPIGNDTIYKFDVAHDKVNLIGFSGLSGFVDVQTRLSENSNGDAVVTIAEGESITFDGVSAASLTANNFVFNRDTVMDNASSIVIGDNAVLPLGGTVNNSGTIELASIVGQTRLQVLANGLTFEGGGHVNFSDSNGNIIVGTTPDATLTNVDNTISGAGQLGEGQLALHNEGTIIASGSSALTIDTAANAIVNSGTLEAVGSGGLDIHSDIANFGLLWANGGSITIDGDVSGTGSALINGAALFEMGGAFGQNVKLDADANATLKIDHAADFSGTVAGFDANDALDLADLAFDSNTTLGYAANSSNTGGTLTVSDGTSMANIALLGQYAAASFVMSADGFGGTLIHDLPPATQTQMLTQPQHA